MFGRKKEKLLGSEIEPRCAWCTHFSESKPENPCRLGRDPGTEAACREFVYDPLLRTPEGPPPLKRHDPGEFTL